MEDSRIETLIGELELIATAIEPGLVFSKEMSLVSITALFNAINELKKMKLKNV